MIGIKNVRLAFLPRSVAPWARGGRVNRCVVPSPCLLAFREFLDGVLDAHPVLSSSNGHAVKSWGSWLTFPAHRLACDVFRLGCASRLRPRTSVPSQRNNLQNQNYIN